MEERQLPHRRRPVGAGRGGRHRVESLKTAIFGYAMNDMGDIRVDESALINTSARRSSR